jgi:cell wall-associated NlpC family hydrolase
MHRTTEEQAALRSAVVAEARSWLGTPFRDNGATKGIAVDCAMLLREVYVSTGVLEFFEPRPYSTQWMLHQDEELFLSWIQKFGPETNEIKPGNVIVYQFGRCFSHGAVIVNERDVVHAYKERMKCVVSQLNDIKLTHIGHTDKPRPFKIFDPITG